MNRPRTMLFNVLVRVDHDSTTMERAEDDVTRLLKAVELMPGVYTVADVAMEMAEEPVYNRGFVSVGTADPIELHAVAPRITGPASLPPTFAGHPLVEDEDATPALYYKDH